VTFDAEIRKKRVFQARMQMYQKMPLIEMEIGDEGDQKSAFQ
jgi:hypothetical protein